MQWIVNSLLCSRERKSCELHTKGDLAFFACQTEFPFTQTHFKSVLKWQGARGYVNYCATMSRPFRLILSDFLNGKEIWSSDFQLMQTPWWYMKIAFGSLRLHPINPKNLSNFPWMSNFFKFPQMMDFPIPLQEGILERTDMHDDESNDCTSWYEQLVDHYKCFSMHNACMNMCMKNWHFGSSKCTRESERAIERSNGMEMGNSLG